MVFSIWDWSRWRQAELARFGQGPQNQATTPALPLAMAWQSLEVGVRVAPPLGWTVQADPVPSGLWSMLPPDRPVEVVNFASGSVQIRVWAAKFAGDLSGAANQRVAKLPPLVREREYISTDWTDLTVLTWAQGEWVKQSALAIKAERLVVVEAAAPATVWASYEPTFGAVYRSVVLF